MLLAFFKKSSRTENRSDSDLVRAFRDTRDPAPCAILFERYALQIFGICRAYFRDEQACEDAAMEMYEYLLEQLQRYEVDNFKHWLGRATKNFCLMRIRKQSAEDRRLTDFQADANGLMENEADLHLEEDSGLVEEKLKSALDGLNDKQRVCIEMFFFRKLSYEDISQQTGFTLNEVKSYIQNGKRNLKIRLEDQG